MVLAIVQCQPALVHTHTHTHTHIHTEVGEVVGVADSTIRQTYRLIFKDRDKLFPSDFQFTTPLDELPNH